MMLQDILVVGPGVTLDVHRLGSGGPQHLGKGCAHVLGGNGGFRQEHLPVLAVP